MKDSPLINKSKSFALEVLRVCKELRSTKCEGVLINQFIRSGTSIGANIAEAECAVSKNDFVSKLYIALKECNETSYWLDLLHETGYLRDDVFQSIFADCEELKRILTASTKTIRYRTF